MTQVDLNFVTPPAEGPVRFILDNDWSGTHTRSHQVDMTRLERDAPTDFERDGFVRRTIPSKGIDFTEIDEVTRRWMPAALDAALEVTGGSWGVLFAGPLIRFSNRDPRAMSSSVSAPARAVHADLHASFTFDQLRTQPLGEAAADLAAARLGGREPRRWRVVNIWQMLSDPPQDNTLALCRLDSVAPGDVVEGAGIFDEPGIPRDVMLADPAREKQFDITFFRAAPNQQWCCFPELQRDDALIFSTFVPQAAMLHGRVAHGAVDLSVGTGEPVPRSSIKIRALVVLEE